MSVGQRDTSEAKKQASNQKDAGMLPLSTTCPLAHQALVKKRSEHELHVF